MPARSGYLRYICRKILDYKSMSTEEIQKNKETFLRHCREHIKREGLEALLAYLETTDFYLAPSSSNFHSNEDGGLCKHSINVFETACTIYEQIVAPAIQSGQSPFEGEVSLESIAIAALFHDLCKVKMYHKTEKWKKDENGRWMTYPGYEINDEFPFGHGDKSCIMLSWFVRLKQEELLAIRWHMGMFDAGEPGSSTRFSMRAALEKSPLVALLQAADALAANCLERTTKWK